MSDVRVSEIQKPLRLRYQSEPNAAWVTDRAQTKGTEPDDPFHSTVLPMPECGVAIPIGVHRAVGGVHDAPTPGDVLCAALAACQDSSIRMVANILGIVLEAVEVEVTANVDVRGTLGIDVQVPVGFQSMRCMIRIQARPGTNPQLLEKLRAASERSCVVRQTLLHPPHLETQFDVSARQAAASAVLS